MFGQVDRQPETGLELHLYIYGMAGARRSKSSYFCTKLVYLVTLVYIAMQRARLAMHGHDFNPY